jgi:putative copper export protein
MLQYAHLFTICAAAIYDVAFAATAGLLLCRLWLGDVGEAVLRKSMQRCLVLVTTVMLLVLPLQIFLLAVSMTGADSWQLAWSSLPDVVSAHAGHALAISLCIIPLLCLSVLLSSRRIWLTWVQFILLLAITIFRSSYGHAASEGDFTLRECLQLLHLTSIGVWAGGVVIAGFLIVPNLTRRNQHEQLIHFTARLSSTVTVALVVVVVSGLYNSWQGLGHSLTSLTHSAWGVMLLVKTAVVVVTFAHGVRCRMLLQPGFSTCRSRSMQRWMRSEALLMLLVLILSAWLANLPPADA